MRKSLATAASIVLVGSLGFVQPAIAGSGSDAAHRTRPAKAEAPLSSKLLRDAVTVNQILRHERQLQVIANRNDGTRASGLPGFTASADYVTKTLRASGYKVRRQPFTFPLFRELAPATLTQTAPTTREVETATMDYSGSGDVTGALVPIDLTLPPSPEPGSTSGCEASDFPAPSGTQVALVQRGTCTFYQKAANAQAAGYAAVVIFNEGQPGRQELLTGTLGDPVDIPVVGVSYADGAALAEVATEVRVTTSTEVDPERTTENVIADLPVNVKAKKPDEVVVVGAHLDSVVAGPGINDNGSGSSTILEIARQMADLKLTRKLQRPVRFVFYGAEEEGLLGSTHYVDSLSDANRSKIYANLNFDMLGSPNYVRFVYDGDGSDSAAGPPGSGAIEKIFTDYFVRRGLESEPTAFDGRSDYGPYIDAGIPAGGLFSGAEDEKSDAEAAIYGGTAGVAYDSCYHQACDTITNLNTSALNELGDAAAHATYVLTVNGKALYPDSSRPARARAARAAPLEHTGHALGR